jgi:hypothetical protein
MPVPFALLSPKMLRSASGTISAPAFLGEIRENFWKVKPLRPRWSEFASEKALLCLVTTSVWLVKIACAGCQDQKCTHRIPFSSELLFDLCLEH